MNFKKIKRIRLYKVTNVARIILNRYNWRRSLTNKEFSVICNNCLGGIVVHQLGLRFNSPFVNLYIAANDYIELLENLENYMKETLEDITPVGAEYPIGLLGGKIKIHFMHYDTFGSAKNSWYRRCKRLNMENLYVIMTERKRDGCTLDLIKRFDRLSFKHKVIFCSLPRKEVKSLYYVKGFEISGEVDMTSYLSGNLPLFWQFNWPAFFNQNER